MTTAIKPRVKTAPRRVLATLPASDARRDSWLQAFGTTIVPIFRGGAVPIHVGDQLTMGYLVNVAMLTAEQFRVFRHYCVDCGYADGCIAVFVSRGYAVPADGVIIIESDINLSKS